eukprot:scaffold406_cov57-Cylindrotheca_fusiformis.AAC.10
MKWAKAAAWLFTAGVADAFQAAPSQRQKAHVIHGLQMLNDNFERPLFQANEDRIAETSAAEGPPKANDTEDSGDEKPPVPKAWFATELKSEAEPPEQSPPASTSSSKTAFFVSEPDPIIPSADPITDFMGDARPSANAAVATPMVQESPAATSEGPEASSKDPVEPTAAESSPPDEKASMMSSKTQKDDAAAAGLTIDPVAPDVMAQQDESTDVQSEEPISAIDTGNSIEPVTPNVQSEETISAIDTGNSIEPVTPDNVAEEESTDAETIKLRDAGITTEPVPLDTVADKESNDAISEEALSSSRDAGITTELDASDVAAEEESIDVNSEEALSSSRNTGNTTEPVASDFVAEEKSTDMKAEETISSRDNGTTSELVASDTIAEKGPTDVNSGETLSSEETRKEEPRQGETKDGNMSLSEILEVASEMEDFTKGIARKPVEFINSTPPPPKRKPVEFINSTPPPPKPKVKTEDDIKIERFVQALGDAATVTTKELFKGLLGGLRMTAADVLTKSLPEEDRSKLLERMASTKKAAAAAAASEKQDEDKDTEDEEQVEMRGSVAEEIAVAEAERARLDEERWEAEKEALVQQMEAAANARVESELAIQKERLEQEMKQLQESMEASKRKLETEKKELEEKLSEEAESEKQDELGDITDMGNAEVSKLKAILDEREQQKQDLREVEEELKLRIEEIEKKKEFIAKGEQEIKEKAKSEVVPHLSPKEYRDLSQEEKKALKDLRGDKPKAEGEGHPVLGSLVADLGYKRIYLTSSGALGTLPIWKKQRIYRHSRARAMAHEKVKSMSTGFPGSVCLFEDGEGNLSVLDGQHRVGMMQLLRAMQKENETLLAETDGYFDNILVEVYPNPNPESLDDEKHAEAVFLEINKAEPVKLVDMPGVAAARDNKIITTAVARIEEQFPSMFSASQTCRVPNVNVDNMRNNIFGANIIKRHKLRSSKQLFDWLLVQNAAVGASYECDEDRREGISDRAWKKASESCFYLGLEKSLSILTELGFYTDSTSKLSSNLRVSHSKNYGNEKGSSSVSYRSIENKSQNDDNENAVVYTMAQAYRDLNIPAQRPQCQLGVSPTMNKGARSWQFGVKHN